MTADREAMARAWDQGYAAATDDERESMPEHTTNPYRITDDSHCHYAHGQLTSDVRCPWCHRLVPAEAARRPLAFDVPEFDHIERP